MNIDEMTGKQLGIAVAKEVMGWAEWTSEPIDFFVRDYDGPWPVFLSDMPWLCVYYEEGQGLARRWAPWRDWNDMREVIEKIRPLEVRIHAQGTLSGVFIYDVSERLKLLAAATGETARTVLRAALKAVGNK